MSRRAGQARDGERKIRRRDVLKAGLAAGLGFGAMALWEMALPPRPAAAVPVYGGHVTILNAAYPEVWDTHLAGTIGTDRKNKQPLRAPPSRAGAPAAGQRWTQQAGGRPAPPRTDRTGAG